jgi:hypothetical protein
MRDHRVTLRTRLAPLLVALPAIVGACAIVAFEGSRVVRQALRPAMPPGSFAGALRSGEYEEAVAFIRAGQDPNAPIPFTDERLTGDRELQLAPLLVAVATHNDNAVMMLMSFGARLDAPGGRFALCLAERLGYRTMIVIMSRDGGPAAAQPICPTRSAPAEAPLLAFVE